MTIEPLARFVASDQLAPGVPYAYAVTTAAADLVAASRVDHRHRPDVPRRAGRLRDQGLLRQRRGARRRFHGRNAFAFFGTEAATGTTFETYDIPDDFVWPEPEEWYPGPPPGYPS